MFSALSSQCSLPIDIYWLISSSCHCCNLGRPINGKDAVCRFTQRRVTAMRTGLFRNLHSKFIAKWFHIVYCILGCKWLSVFKSLFNVAWFLSTCWVRMCTHVCEQWTVSRPPCCLCPRVRAGDQQMDSALSPHHTSTTPASVTNTSWGAILRDNREMKKFAFLSF